MSFRCHDNQLSSLDGIEHLTNLTDARCELFVVVSIVVVIDVRCRSGEQQSVVVAGWHRALDQFDGAQSELFVVVSIVVLIDVRCRSGVDNQLSSLDGIEH